MMTLRQTLLRLIALLALGVWVGAAGAQDKSAPVDLLRQPTLYVAPYSHLDTQYRWTFPQVINEYLPRTVRDNFALIEKYPHYIFNFTGANRYLILKEYYPADYEKLKRYVAAGRWFPCGSEMEESNVNVPAAESLFRQILYGNGFFRREFGKAGADLVLPDCFGFPASLPSILSHAGVKGFSTSKLTFHGAAPAGGRGSPQNTPSGVPFNVGVWEGTNGESVLAVLNAGVFNSRLTNDPTTDATWINRILGNGKAGGVFADFRYFGTGDSGGAPSASSVKILEDAVSKASATAASASTKAPASQGTLRVLFARSDQIFWDILAAKPDPTPKLPRYKGDLELVEHSAGSLTSQAYQKRWNRMNELLADAAERASVAAQWLGARPYPLERLNRAWTLVMSGQFHDVLPGTAIPEAFEFAWNDDVLAMNQFADVLLSGTEGVASVLNTQVQGTAVVVYNPLGVEREDVVRATVAFPGALRRRSASLGRTASRCRPSWPAPMRCCSWPRRRRSALRSTTFGPRRLPVRLPC